jgi:hypothetical protein
MSGGEHAWQVRARRISSREIRAYARNHVVSIGVQASLRDKDDHPSAIEVALGALAADLLAGLEVQAARRGIAVHAGEVNLSARLDNVLVHLGVIGEVGSPRLAAISGTLDVSADVDDAALAELWRDALARSPLYQTLSQCASIDLRVRATI